MLPIEVRFDGNEQSGQFGHRRSILQSPRPTACLRRQLGRQIRHLGHAAGAARPAAALRSPAHRSGRRRPARQLGCSLRAGHELADLLGVDEKTAWLAYSRVLTELRYAVFFEVEVSAVIHHKPRYDPVPPFGLIGTRLGRRGPAQRGHGYG